MLAPPRLGPARKADPSTQPRKALALRKPRGLKKGNGKRDSLKRPARLPWLFPHLETCLKPVYCTVIPPRTGGRRWHHVWSWVSSCHPATAHVAFPSALLHNRPKNREGGSGGRTPLWERIEGVGGRRGEPVQPANGQMQSLTGRMGNRGGWGARDTDPEAPFASSTAG